MPEITIVSKVRNSYLTVLVADFQFSEINAGTSQHTMTSNEKRKNIFSANGQQSNHPSNIVNKVSTKNTSHYAKDQKAGNSQPEQNL